MGSIDCMFKVSVHVLLDVSTTLTVFWKLFVLLQVTGFVSHVPKADMNTLVYSEPA